MDKISSIRGMPDVFESDTNYLAELNEVLSKIFLSHNLNEVNTPILEQTELFVRSTGVTSDIVNKEIYSFNDRNEQSLSLRPEGTAGVVRSIIQKKLDNAEHKLWYHDTIVYARHYQVSFGLLIELRQLFPLVLMKDFVRFDH